MANKPVYGWLDYINVSAQIYQSTQQSAIKGALQNQVQLANYKIQQGERIARGRRALIEYERLVDKSNETFERYPHYTYSVLQSNLIEFNQMDLAGTFFMETEDMKNAISVQKLLEDKLQFFASIRPIEFEEEIRTAYEKFNEYAEMESNGFPKINDAINLSESLIEEKAQLERNKNQLKDLDSNHSLEIFKAKEAAAESGSKLRKAFIPLALILLIINFGIIPFFTTSVKIVDYGGLISAIIMVIFSVRYIFSTIIPQNLRYTEGKINNTSRDIHKGELSIRTMTEKLESMLNSAGVNNLDELSLIPQNYRDILMTYFPEKEIFQVPSVAKIIHN